jgi:hypothetical protein
MSSNFFSAQHIFYPVTLQFPWPNVEGKMINWDNIALIFISPRSKTVDFLDSHFNFNKRPKVIGNVFRLLAQHLGHDFIPSEWRMREGASAQQKGHEMVRYKPLSLLIYLAELL